MADGDDSDERRPWPPVYDVDTLRDTIARVSKALPKDFYVLRFDDPEPCQGDVIELRCDVPVIDAAGEPSAVADGITHWLVVSNSCDASRTMDEVEYIPIVPLVPVVELDEAERAAIEESARRYELSRVFYIPSWDETAGSHLADFTRFISVHRSAMADHASIRARMRLDSWVLLNACLVRLLCREDRRHD